MKIRKRKTTVPEAGDAAGNSKINRSFCIIVLGAGILFCAALGLTACMLPEQRENAERFTLGVPRTALLADADYARRSRNAGYSPETAALPEQPEREEPTDTDEAAACGLRYTDGTYEETDAQYSARIEKEEQERRTERGRRQREVSARIAEQVKAEKAEREARLAAEQAERDALEALRRRTPGYNEEFVETLTEEKQREAEQLREEGFVFYRQNWSSLKTLSYGSDGFGQCGCGPTCTAELIANLAGVPVTPADMRTLALESHSVMANGATTYDFILRTTAEYGLKASDLAPADTVGLSDALRSGKLVLVVMGPGDFTLGSHFVLYRGITDDGKVLISDSYSCEHTVTPWDYADLYAQTIRGCWVFEKAE